MANLKERLSIQLPKRMKRMVKDIADDQNRTMNDVIVAAVSEYIDRVNLSHSAPDLVLDRMNQLFTIQVQNTQILAEVRDLLHGLNESD